MRGLTFVLVMSVVATLVAAQDQPNYTFKSNVNLVTFTATVTDGQGRYVRGLRPDHVAVWEDGVRQQISLFRAEIEPVSMGIVFDTSGSMEHKIHDVADAVAHFVNTAQPEDEIFLLRFSSKAELMMDFTSDRGALSREVYNLRAGGSTVLYDAVSQALAKVQTGRHRKRALVVITDGEDTNSHTRLEVLEQQARQAEVLVYTIGIGAQNAHREWGRNQGGSRGGSTIRIGGFPWPIPRGGNLPGGGGSRGEDTVDMQVLTELADAGGARAYQVDPARGDMERFDNVVQEISAELRQQYTIGYYHSNAAHDGSYRRIQITTSFPDYRVRARRGYYAPRE